MQNKTRKSLTLEKKSVASISGQRIVGPSNFPWKPNAQKQDGGQRISLKRCQQEVDIT